MTMQTPTVRVRIDVLLKDEILDPAGQAVERNLPKLGFDGVRDVRIGKHIELEVPAGDDLATRVEAMAVELLVNPLLETYTWSADHATSPT